MSLQLAIGLKVLVCDNLAFSGDLIALKRRHTSRLDLATELARAFDRYQEGMGRLKADVERLKQTELTETEARLLIYQVFEQAIMPVRFLPTVHRLYFLSEEDLQNPEMQPCASRSLWGLHNAFTHQIQSMEPGPAFQATVRLGQIFGLGQPSRN